MKILVWLSIGLDRRTPSEHLLTAIVKALTDKGHTVHILQKDTGGSLPEIPHKIAVLGVTTTRIRSVQTERSNLLGRYLEDIKYFLKCKKWIKLHKDYDRVFLQSSNIAGLQVYILRGVIRDIPITFNVQDIFPENAIYSGTLSKNGIPYKIFSQIQRYAYHNVQNIITISEDMKEQLVAIGVPEHIIEVIYNWSYQDNLYDPTQLDYTRVLPLFDQSKFNKIYAGNIGRMQNVEVVLKIAEQMKDYEDIIFHIFGNGVYRDKLIHLAEQDNIRNVFFHDMLDARDAPALYAIANINIIPLAKNIYRTALPSKTATCLACGKPIILAIGSESIFGKKLSNAADVQLVDVDDIKSIQKTILEIKKRTEAHRKSEYFSNHFSITANSEAYATIITGG